MGVVSDDFRANFAQLVLLLLDGNSNHLIKQLLYMNIITPEQSTDEFRMDVDDLLNTYVGVELDQMDGIFDSLMNVMIRHNIILPREFVIIGRGILLIEDAGNRLDPHFNLTTELEKFAKKNDYGKIQTWKSCFRRIQLYCGNRTSVKGFAGQSQQHPYQN